ncbi:hypothetical protein MVEN_01895700 [Mycena venus]|uniref:Uncharacterized protein n=1 Tax=Mycena venus TaxID=2733690 RepID=A0A8H7CKZ0_9AGAR|nr:hypothetical protein MVEN_01895700 [Mycena venus]
MEGGEAVEKKGEVQQYEEHSDSDGGDWESSDEEDVLSELLWLASLDPAGSSVFLDAARKFAERPSELEGDLASADSELGTPGPDHKAEEEDYAEDEAVSETVDELLFIASLDPAGPRSEFFKAAVALLQDS